MIELSQDNDEYLTNYIFEVQFGDSATYSFSKISNIASGTDYEIIGDGGNNDYMYLFEKPNRKPETIIFERGLKKSSDGEKIYIVQGLKINNIMILVKKGDVTERIFFIEQGMVTKMSYTDLDASHGEILVSRMEMQHTGIIEMPV